MLRILRGTGWQPFDKVRQLSNETWRPRWHKTFNALAADSRSSWTLVAFKNTLVYYLKIAERSHKNEFHLVNSDNDGGCSADVSLTAWSWHEKRVWNMRPRSAICRGCHQKRSWHPVVKLLIDDPVRELYESCTKERTSWLADTNIRSSKMELTRTERRFIIVTAALSFRLWRLNQQARPGANAFDDLHRPY